MSQFWIGPLLLASLCLVWLAVQKAWLSCMNQPPDRDALKRPGTCGTACLCRPDCPRRRERADLSSNKET